MHDLSRSVRPRGEVPVIDTPTNRLLFAGVLLCALAGCGDDDDDGVGLGRTDGGARDAAADAAPLDADVGRPPGAFDAGYDAGRKPGKPPEGDDDGGAPRCFEHACSRKGDECNDAHCDAKTGECKLTPRANGISCGSDVLDNCGAPDTCQAGKCMPNDAPKGTACGDQSKDCRKDDACDGHGKCIDNGFEKEGAKCGDQKTNTACDKRDTCDAQGECKPNFAPVDAPCGDQDKLCRNNDSCDGLGECIDSGAWTPGQCPMGESDGYCLCGSTSVNTCHLSADVCVGTTCVFGNVPDGTSCGDPTPNHPVCDAADTCLSGKCSPNNTDLGVACGDPTNRGICDAADSCDGAGGCSPNFASSLTVCAEASDECLGDSLCSGTGTCQSPQPAPLGTACGSTTETSCNHADSCNASGVCQQNFAGNGTPCGNSSSAECNAPDTCDGAGLCDPRYAVAGSACGDQNQACKNNDMCSDHGTCLDQGSTATCAIAGTLRAGNAPAPGVTIELLGTGATSTVTDAQGDYEITVPLGQTVMLYVHDTTGYWGFVQPTVFTADDQDVLFSLIADADLASVSAEVQLESPQTAPPIDPAKGVVVAQFAGHLTANDRVTSSAAGTMPVARRMDGALVYSSTIMTTSDGAMYFFDVEGTSTTLTPSAGCQLTPSSSTTLPVRAHAVTVVSLTCD